MRVLLRDETGLYYRSEEEWTASAGNAVDFKKSLLAMEFARVKGLIHAKVVLSFENSAYDISLPVRYVGDGGESGLSGG